MKVVYYPIELKNGKVIWELFIEVKLNQTVQDVLNELRKIMDCDESERFYLRRIDRWGDLC